MIPSERFSDPTFRGSLLNPWSRDRKISYHWGPVQVQDPSQGLLVKVWTLEAVGADAILSAPGSTTQTLFTRGVDIDNVNLSFDQNGRPCVCYEEEGGGAYLFWFDPVPNEQTHMPIPGDAVSPRITLDDARQFNGDNSDVILGYVRAGVVRYRQQRDRFTVEYTPPVGPGGAPAEASSLRHISMNSNLRLEFLTDGGGSEDWTLADVVEEICERAGLDAQKQRVTQLYQDIVRGFTTSVAHPAHGSLQALSQVYFFTPANVGGRVEFVKLGANAVTLVSEDDMIDDDTDVEADSRRGDSIGIPRVLHLNYYDVAGGLNTDKQHSERPEGTRAEGEMSLQTAVVLSHDEAATIVSKNHAMIAETQKGELHVPLPDSYLFLTESDPIHVHYEGKVVRGVISESVVMDGEQRYRVVRDRQSIHTMDVQGIPPAPVTRPPSSIVGATLLEVLDIPIVRDSDDALGVYIAVSGVMPAWQGALVELSMDGGQTYIEGHTVRADTIMGSLLTELGDHPQAFPDSVNSCQVSIGTPNAVLEGSSLSGMMSRRNLAVIGDEIVNFAEADEVSEGVWEVSHFLRGRRGTQTQAHPVGVRFVMMSGAIFVPGELVMLDRPITVRATSLGTDNETVVSLTFTGQSQVERAPAYLQARREGADVVASWQGVGRIGGGTHVAMGQHFAGYRVTITDGTTTQTHNTPDSEFTGTLSAFSGPVTVRVQQRNNFTGLGPAIEVTI